MKQYFKDCKNLDELKKAYRKLVQELHPDRGGDCKTFCEMKAQYDEATKRLAQEAARQEHAKRQEKQAAGQTVYGDERSAEDFIKEQQDYAAVVEALINLDGLTIELCGSWLWISGNTYTHKAILKETGCKWSKNKGCWYWHPAGYAAGKHKAFTMDKIRAQHGSEILTTSKAERLTA